jgi:hypothetical protein
VVLSALLLFCFSVYRLFFVIHILIHMVQWRKLLLLCDLT